ncbi:S-layer homology domain-containing protein [Paenibacillus sp. y28]|uniref:S-layer homology domain-containing protein n=1 Tax=Paenibacillus sp. y28 TaxID=3129110 RepID=UPI003019B670
MKERNDWKLLARIGFYTTAAGVAAILLAGPDSGASAATGGPASPAFTDVSGHWAEEQIRTAVKAGFVNGFEDGTFGPDEPVTREQFLGMAVRALQGPQASAASASDSWFAPVYQAAVDQAWYKDDYTGGWDLPITRGEIAGTLVRVTEQPLTDKLLQEAVTAAFPAPSQAENPDIQTVMAGPDFTGDWRLLYTDPKQVMADLEQALVRVKQRKPPELLTPTEECARDENMCGYAISLEQGSIDKVLKMLKKAIDPINKLQQARTSSSGRMVYEAASRGLLTGTGTGELSLEAPATRAQAVTFVNRVLAFNAGQRFTTDKYTVGAAEIMWHRTNMLTMLPRYFGKAEEEFRDDLLVAEADQGNARCETEKFIVIDLDNPDDPNRSFIPEDARWTVSDDRNERDIQDSAYAVIAMNRLTIRQMPEGFAHIWGCSIQMTPVKDQTGELQGAGKLDQMAYLRRNITYKPNGEFLDLSYAQEGINKYGEIRTVAESDGGAKLVGSLREFDTRYVTGFLIPKGDLSPDDFNGRPANITLYFTGLTDYGQGANYVYRSYVGPSIHQ